MIKSNQAMIVRTHKKASKQITINKLDNLV